MVRLRAKVSDHYQCGEPMEQLLLENTLWELSEENATTECSGHNLGQLEALKPQGWAIRGH